MADYITTIGLEVHAQVLTASKMFDACPAGYANTAPNSCTSVVSLGLPGSLPVTNQRAIELAAMTGLSLNCTINPFSIFARKNYTYPDLPKGYQITQYDQPLCRNGWIEIHTGAGETRRIRIERLHIEEDTGRNLHLEDGTTLIDYNRAGVPLMEIVSEPDITTPEDARLYFEKIHQILTWIGVNTGNMAEGALRCDANVSIRPVGQERYGTKVEVKNMNSFRSVERALVYEIQRQVGVLESGGTVHQETRGWDENREVTVGQRSKEFAHDYRYFPEPDIPPLRLSESWIAARQEELPELPDGRRTRFEADYGLSTQDAGLLTIDRSVADYYERAVAAASEVGGSAKEVANWVAGELFRLLKEHGESYLVLETRMPPRHIAAVLDLLAKGTITRTVAKQVFEESYASGNDPAQIVASKGLSQISDEEALVALAHEVIASNPKPVEQYRQGKASALQFLVGQMMKATRGQANPQVARAVLEAALEKNEEGR
ncbi:MAG: Asp-tRNA(Asn)/Glu-tRNA(Gln) amidotransferase subunit GatB [Chloroflexaceae bacterium]|nr:Asp-tRNA(Asn)/Glu-tRNA(Gln) amidotransferase subunit GatB [Chloroflexaceae bacterium]